MNAPLWMRHPKFKLVASIVVGITIFASALWWLSGYAGWRNKTPGVTVVSNVDTPATPVPETPAAPSAVPFKVEEVTANLKTPWAIVFTSPTRMLVTERDGFVRVVENGKLQASPLTTFGEVSTISEEGLMGLTKDPNYAQNHFLYTCLAYAGSNGMRDKIVRFKDQPGGGERTIILDNIPAAQYHAGCRLKFGPDNKLYVTTGDATTKTIAQDMQSLGGKILRINADGSIPADNPFAGSPVWSYGHRNPQGLDWQPGTGNLLATEHGPSGNDGPLGGDEVNFINKGANYGWPLVSHDRTREGTVAPLLVFTPAVAPAAGMFYSGTALPQLNGNYFFAMLKGQGLYRIIFDKKEPTQIISREKVVDVNVGRVREVIQGPDGSIYFTSSNRDGRGDIRQGDDKIYRLTPR